MYKGLNNLNSNFVWTPTGSSQWTPTGSSQVFKRKHWGQYQPKTSWHKKQASDFVNIVLYDITFKLFYQATSWARVWIPLCHRFEDLVFSFSPLMPQLTQLYKWVPGHREWWKCEWIVVAHNCCVARMLTREVELVSEWTGLPGRAKSLKRFERSNGLNTALYKNYLFFTLRQWLKNVEF